MAPLSIVSGIYALTTVAKTTKRLQIIDRVRSSEMNRNDMINFQLDFRLTSPAAQAVIAIEALEGFPFFCRVPATIRSLFGVAGMHISLDLFGVIALPGPQPQSIGFAVLIMSFPLCCIDLVAVADLVCAVLAKCPFVISPVVGSAVLTHPFSVVLTIALLCGVACIRVAIALLTLPYLVCVLLCPALVCCPDSLPVCLNIRPRTRLAAIEQAIGLHLYQTR